MKEHVLHTAAYCKYVLCNKKHRCTERRGESESEERERESRERRTADAGGEREVARQRETEAAAGTMRSSRRASTRATSRCVKLVFYTGAIVPMRSPGGW